MKPCQNSYTIVCFVLAAAVSHTLFDRVESPVWLRVLDIAPLSGTVQVHGHLHRVCAHLESGEGTDLPRQIERKSPGGLGCGGRRSLGKSRGSPVATPD